MNRIVSIVVPTKNSAGHIENCLKSIINQSYKNIELIVVDNNSKDNTKQIARKYTKYVYNKGPERSTQRNFGKKKSHGDYLLFIDSDMELDTDIVKECIKTFETSIKKNKAAITIPEISRGESFWAKCKALERSFYLGVDWIEAPRFFSKKIFESMNGYDENQTGTEDYDLPQRIKGKYGKNSVLRIKKYIYHNEGNLSLMYTLRKKFYYVKTGSIYINNSTNATYFKKQASIFERYKLFFKNPKKLFKDPLLGMGMLFMKTSEFMAGGLGYITSKL